MDKMRFGFLRVEGARLCCRESPHHCCRATAPPTTLCVRPHPEACREPRNTLPLRDNQDGSRIADRIHRHDPLLPETHQHPRTHSDAGLKPVPAQGLVDCARSRGPKPSGVPRHHGQSAACAGKAAGKRLISTNHAFHATQNRRHQSNSKGVEPRRQAGIVPALRIWTCHTLFRTCASETADPWRCSAIDSS